MSREAINYSRPPRAAADWRGAAFDPDEPVAGYYETKLRRCAPISAVRIWRGPSLDPEGQETVDRPHLWQCSVNGARVDITRFWPDCASKPISRETHDMIVERNMTMDPESPFYDPSRPIDLNTAPPPF